MIKFHSDWAFKNKIKCLPLTHVAFDHHHLDVNSFSGRAIMVSLPPLNDDDDDDINIYFLVVQQYDLDCVTDK